MTIVPDFHNSTDRIITRAEQIIAERLLSLLSSMATGDRIQDFLKLQEVLGALERFIPEVLGEVHPEWTHESLDGVFPLVAEKTGVRTMSIFGPAIVMSNQSVVPLAIELQVSPTGGMVTWLHCKLGATSRSGKDGASINFFHRWDGERDLIDWAYIVAYGPRAD